MLSALVLSMVVVGLSNTAQADHRSHGHNYGSHHSYSRPTYGHGHSYNHSYSRPSYSGIYYSQPGFSLSFGNSYPSYGYSNYGYGNSGFGGGYSNYGYNSFGHCHH